MKVLVAEKRGFCFGVEHAIEVAEKLLHQRKKVYCLGPLIHNSQVVQQLSRAGLEVVKILVASEESLKKRGAPVELV